MEFISCIFIKIWYYFSSSDTYGKKTDSWYGLFLCGIFKSQIPNLRKGFSILFIFSQLLYSY